MAVSAHCFDFGALDLAVHDRVVEALAVGAVLATCVWLATMPALVPLEQLGVRYTGAPAYLGDLGVQHVRICESLVGSAVTCLDMAIYEAACYRAAGVEAWVEVVRDSDDQTAHAIVVFPNDPGVELDPSSRFRTPSETY